MIRSKRLIDLISLVALAPVVAPIFVLVALAVWVTMGRPIFFLQARGGYQGSVFRLWKFRSMTNARDNEGVLLPDAQRLTKFGRLLRSTSLDELPCLLNLLRGDLTLIGPRPFISSYLPLYSSEQSRRHDVVPGITGLAQVNGRNSISWEEKFALDIWYVDNQSVKLDFCIICKTVINVVSRRDISESDHFTMPEFTGKINDPK